MFALQASTALKNAQMYSVLEKEIKERQEAEKELQSYKIHLEELVEQRTQQLKQSKESLQQERDLFIGGQVAIFKWLDKVDSSIEYVSPNINSILGYTVDELTRGSITYFDLVHEGDRQQIIDEINTAVNSESTYITHSPFRMLTKNKQTVWMQDFTTIIRDNDGSIVHFLGYLVDITEKVQAEEKLKSKQTQLAHSGRLASLGEMATGVAHELNQPLAIIRVQAEVLRLGARMNADSNDPLINDLNEIIGQVDRASAIIDHMRGYARIESENDLEVDLTQPVLSSLSFFREQFKNHCINLITEFDDGLPLLGINHQRFEQVVVNFMSNARYAVDKKGESQTCEYNKEVLVRIINRRALKQVLFEVEDNGIGMSTDEMDRCLEPFYTQKEVGEGTGLGLSIVNSIIREFDGKLEIESEPDKGTLMRIVIPV
ncbi:MAG: PAS domain-containing protein [FCB group bacterium]|nr:PAS domain-containing protein [FCB group bacterium]